MTFENALAHLPECSYAVSKKQYGAQQVLELWVLYEEADPPRLDECPCAYKIRTRYMEDGHPVEESRHEEHMVAELVPPSIQELEWTSTPASYEDLPTEANAQRVLNVLRAIPQK